MASEEMSFENVDGRWRTTDACLYYEFTYEPSAQVSYKDIGNISDYRSRRISRRQSDQLSVTMLL